MSGNEAVTQWWRENDYGFSLDDWGEMIKLLSQGNYADVYRKIALHGQGDHDKEIIAELELLDLARSGKYSKDEIDEIRAGPRLVEFDESAEKYVPKLSYASGQHRMTRCQSDDDGYCEWTWCPQLRDKEPRASGRHCPWDIEEDDDVAD